MPSPPFQPAARERSRWEALAASFPYYAVLTESRYLGQPDAATRRAFFETGESYVDQLLTRVASFTGGVAAFRTVLEYGCGPGRLVCAFARRGFEVTAVDLSPKMLALAKSNAEERNCLGVTFLTVEDFARQETQYDLVNATLVLQQIEPAAGIAIVAQLLARVAPGGFLHLQVPYQTDRGARSRAVLSVRKRVPLVNRAVNVLRKRPANAPVITPSIYSLDDLFQVLREGEGEVRTVELSRENELEVATIVVRRQMPKSDEPKNAAPVAAAATPDDFIDVKELMRSMSLADLHRRAEEYFASAPSLDAQLAKPFANPAETPVMLINLGVLLSGMRLVHGHTVLDFGAGTGWLSRSLARMGCRMIVSDVSPTALRVAEENLGPAPYPPRFLLFDGYRIDLPDASVDRIICFDAFHHVPNPEVVLRELGRILKPGGLAGFSEPGPQHSRSALSQFEMRTYGVLENDVDIHAIREWARDAGFVDLQLAIYNGTPPKVRLEQFDELLRGGEALLDAAHATRNFLENVRIFYLQKAGNEEVDSRTASALASRIEVRLTDTPRAGRPIPVTATVTNIGTATWLPADATPGGVALGCHLSANGTLVSFDHYWQPLSETRGIAPGEEVTTTFELPPLEPGQYDLEFDCVAREVTWFAQVGSTPFRLSEVRVR